MRKFRRGVRRKVEVGGKRWFVGNKGQGVARRWRKGMLLPPLRKLMQIFESFFSFFLVRRSSDHCVECIVLWGVGGAVVD